MKGYCLALWMAWKKVPLIGEPKEALTKAKMAKTM
jgi:hypothetical protein